MFDGTLLIDSTVVGLENLTRVKYYLIEVNIGGIVCVGGTWKTTFANVICDDVKSTYNASCFVG